MGAFSVGAYSGSRPCYIVGDSFCAIAVSSALTCPLQELLDSHNDPLMYYYCPILSRGIFLISKPAIIRSLIK